MIACGLGLGWRRLAMAVSALRRAGRRCVHSPTLKHWLADLFFADSPASAESGACAASQCS